MSKRPKRPRESVVVAAVSGGPDSVYLFHKTVASGKGTRVVVGHVNYGSRGADSGKDQKLVEDLGRSTGMETKVLKLETSGNFPAGFEGKARDVRNDFLKKLAAASGAGKIAIAHTADEQVETILMRFFEGAGIAGLKGIPRETEGGIVRPILDVWKEDVIKYLKKNKISYRIDKSNFDTRFERNWIRHVLIPLLEKRYGKTVKKRIFTLGERFRELDEYLETEACRWIRRNVKSSHPPRTHLLEKEGIPAQRTGGPARAEAALDFPRAGYSRLPMVLRVRIIQRVCFDLLGLAPNERLLQSVDRTVCEGGPSARVKVGRGWELANRYGQAAFVSAGDGGRAGKTPGGAGPGEPVLKVEEKGKVTPAQAKRAAASGGKEYFDAAGIRKPLSVRPLRAGDRIRPFGLEAEKKVKEILIDRKVPRDERWGRPVVCDAEGKILWIPGVVRSALAPVGPETEKTVLLKLGRK